VWSCNSRACSGFYLSVFLLNIDEFYWFTHKWRRYYHHMDIVVDIVLIVFYWIYFDSWGRRTSPVWLQDEGNSRIVLAVCCGHLSPCVFVRISSSWRLIMSITNFIASNYKGYRCNDSILALQVCTGQMELPRSKQNSNWLHGLINNVSKISLHFCAWFLVSLVWTAYGRWNSWRSLEQLSRL